MKRRSSFRFRRPKPIGRSCWVLGRFSTVATSRLLMCPVLLLGRPLHRGDDVLVARAPTDRAGDRGADLVISRVRVLVEKGAGRHQHPRSAEAALQRVLLVKAL